MSQGEREEPASTSRDGYLCGHESDIIIATYRPGHVIPIVGPQ